MFILINSHAQITTYQFDLPGLIFTNMIRHNDTLVLPGIIARGDSFTVQDLIIVRLDTSGQFIDYHTYRDSAQGSFTSSILGRPTGFIRDIDGSYVAVNQIYDRTSMLTKINVSGEVEWMRELTVPETSDQTLADILPVVDGYLIFGSVEFSDAPDDIVLVKTDLEGKYAWHRLYGHENNIHDGFNDYLKLSDNRIVVSGATAKGDVPLEEIEFTKKIFEIDSIGEVQWYWESAPSRDQTVYGLNRTDDGNWSYGSIFADYVARYNFKCMPKFIRRDSSFNLISETELDDADAIYNYFLDIIPLADGGFLGTGINYEKGDPYNHAYAWMIKIDADGQVEWERKDRAFADPDRGTAQFLHSAVELPDGNIIAAGYYYTMSDPEVYGLLIKVDKDGCIDTLCTTTSLLEEILADKEKISVYPNPASTDLTVQVPESMDATSFELFDITGRRVMHTQLISGRVSVSLDDLSSADGIHAWRVTDKQGRMLGNGKVSIIRE